MRIMIIVLIAVLSNQLYSQPPQWSLYLTASSECANSQNGTITVTMQLGQTVPNVGPYQLPWDVSYEEINNGDAIVSILIWTNLRICFAFRNRQYLYRLYLICTFYALSADYELYRLKKPLIF